MGFDEIYDVLLILVIISLILLSNILNPYYSTFPHLSSGHILIATVLSIFSNGIHPNALQSVLLVLLSPIQNKYPSGTIKSLK